MLRMLCCQVLGCSCVYLHMLRAESGRARAGNLGRCGIIGLGHALHEMGHAGLAG